LPHLAARARTAHSIMPAARSTIRPCSVKDTVCRGRSPARYPDATANRMVPLLSWPPGSPSTRTYCRDRAFRSAARALWTASSTSRTSRGTGNPLGVLGFIPRCGFTVCGKIIPSLDGHGARVIDANAKQRQRLPRRLLQRHAQLIRRLGAAPRCALACRRQRDSREH